MDAIRKKMQSLKGETDGLYATIQRFEDVKAEKDKESAQHECDIRDIGKKIQNYENSFDECVEKLTQTLAGLEEKETTKADNSLADTVTKLALTSKEADGILKKV